MLMAVNSAAVEMRGEKSWAKKEAGHERPALFKRR
jgi:hypothetical protein